jgi:UDP:flavonoid glycosyltransferase YjiC (YdhE family)
MAKILCYTSPARGHLFPTVPILHELARRGHDVLVLKLADEIGRAGIRARAIAPAIEQIHHDDYEGSSPKEGLERAVRVFVARAEHEIADLCAAIESEKPDLLLVDFNCWGASAVAEKSGLPWALFMPYFLPWRLYYETSWEVSEGIARWADTGASSEAQVRAACAFLGYMGANMAMISRVEMCETDEGQASRTRSGR